MAQQIRPTTKVHNESQKKSSPIWKRKKTWGKAKKRKQGTLGGGSSKYEQEEWEKRKNESGTRNYWREAVMKHEFEPTRHIYKKKKKKTQKQKTKKKKKKAIQKKKTEDVYNNGDARES